MRAWRPAPGGWVVDERELPPPGVGEVQVRVAAAVVDATAPGHSGIGTVALVGDGVRQVAPGARVGFAGCAAGAWAERQNVPAWRLVPVPEAVDDVAAALLLGHGLFAEALVRRAFKAGPGHRVLVQQADHGLGRLQCQWLRHVGSAVVGVVGAADAMALAHAHGCHQVVVRSDGDVAAQVAAWTQQRGVDVVHDGGDVASLRASLRCLRPRGMLVAFGAVAGELSLAELRAGGFFVTTPTLAGYTATRQELLHAADVLWKLVGGGVLRAGPVRVLDLAALPGEGGSDSAFAGGDCVVRP